MRSLKEIIEMNKPKGSEPKVSPPLYVPDWADEESDEVEWDEEVPVCASSCKECPDIVYCKTGEEEANWDGSKVEDSMDLEDPVVDKPLLDPLSDDTLEELRGIKKGGD